MNFQLSDILFPDSTPKILIDDREGDFILYIEEYLIDQIKQGNKPIFDIEVVELQIGDAQVSDSHCFEIKRISKQYNPHEQHNNNDLQSSLWDGRLYEQTIQRQSFAWSGIILEVESGAKITNRFLSQETLNDILDDLCFNYNQHILYSSGFEETLQILLKCLLKSLKKGDHHDPTNKEKRPTSLFDRQRYFLSGMFQIGKKKSLELLKIFKIPAMVIKWISDTLLEHHNGKTRISKQNTTINVPGCGSTFFEENYKLIWTESKEVNQHDEDIENMREINGFDTIKETKSYIPYTKQDWFLLTEAIKRFQVSRSELKENPDLGFSLGVDLEEGESIIICMAKDRKTLIQYMKKPYPVECKNCERKLTMDCNKCSRLNNLQDLFLAEKKEVNNQ
jgi:ERCC4-type nuclease